MYATYPGNIGIEKLETNGTIEELREIKRMGGFKK